MDVTSDPSGPGSRDAAIGGDARDSGLRSLRHAARAQEWLAAGLAMTAGFVDAYGIITYGTYLSFMSGNTTQAGTRAAQGDYGGALASSAAIVSFVGGGFAGALLTTAVARRTRRLIFGVVAASLALIIGLTRLGGLSSGVHVALLGFAMGFMNTALSRVGAQSVSLTFVTGTLSRLGTQLALALRRAAVPDSHGAWDTHVHRALVLAGAALSGAVTPRVGALGLLVPLLILSALAVFDHTAGTPA